MTLEFDTDNKLISNRFSKLGIWYIMALSAIATVSIVGQFMIQNHLTNQRSDSRVINVAGRQRMLSQRITKCVLMITPLQSEYDRKIILLELEPALQLWTLSHEGLQRGSNNLQLPGGNSLEVSSLFSKINEAYLLVKESAEAIIKEMHENLAFDFEKVRPFIQTIIQHQRPFVEGMDKIVFQYDAEANAKVSKLSKMEYSLLAISLVVIVLEILFVFHPTTIRVNETVNQLVTSEKNARKLSKEIGELHNSLEKSYTELSYVNEPPETPKIYARTDPGGNVVFISDLFSEMSGVEKTGDPIPLLKLFQGAGLDEDWMDEVIERVSNGGVWTGPVHYYGNGNGRSEHWADITIVSTLNEEGEIRDWAVLGSDISRQKLAEKTMQEKNRSEVEKKINQQKFRSVLILEGQEEERKRLAMDIHDGIGQMLTSLKYQIESIDTQQAPPGIAAKLSEVRMMAKDIIKEIRRVTFNLKPTVLGDFGLQAALNVFVKEVAKLTDIEIVCRISGEDGPRLPQKVENNIFRIIQEAINNAVKHSGASRIEVLLMQGDESITINVTDNGNGFDEKLIDSLSVNIESGHGFFNMYERTEYVNGKLEIKSTPGHETRVTLTVPVKNPVAV